jgi:hypothetical protein
LGDAEIEVLLYEFKNDLNLYLQKRGGHYQSLEQLIEWRGKPKAIRRDNGPEYISHTLREWAQAINIELMYIHNQASRHKMLILKDLTEQQEMNG